MKHLPASLTLFSSLFCLEGLITYYSSTKKKKKKKKTGCSPLTKEHKYSVQGASSICGSTITNIVNTFCNLITAHVVASRTREKTKLKGNHSMWTGLTLIDMTLIIRQYPRSKIHSPSWRFTICSYLSYDKNKLWLQQYSTTNNSIFHKMTMAANKTTYRYFRYYLDSITL